MFEDEVVQLVVGRFAGEVVEPDAIPRDVVTMNSEVRLRDLARSVGRIIVKQVIGVTRRGLRLIGVRARA